MKQPSCRALKIVLGKYSSNNSSLISYPEILRLDFYEKIDKNLTWVPSLKIP